MINSPIDEIKNRLDIVDVIKGYIKLEKVGANYRALCPFHSEKTPSFFVSPARQRWHCFGSCSEGGDMFGFVMKMEGIEFGDALRILGARAGVEIKKQDPRIKSERQRAYEICEWSTRFFQQQMSSKNGKLVIGYLANRGIEEKEVSEWRIGYAPDSWDDLISFLSGKGYSGEEIKKAGLAGQKDGSSKYYNRFRGRIMFPIFDLNSQPIGFGGRVFEINSSRENEAKYLNTPNTILYDKSRVLYGIHQAKMEIRKKDFCILTEGYTDVIMSHKAGMKNTISTSGTAISKDQLLIVKRYTDNLRTAFDMDDAGGLATERGIDSARSVGFNIKVVVMPLGLDPADIIFKDPERWGEIVEGAVSIMDFYFQKAFSAKNPSLPQDKKSIADELIPKIIIIPNSIERHFWIQKLACDLGTEERVILEEISKLKTPLFLRDTIAHKKRERKTRKDLLEERFLMLASKDISVLSLLSEEDRKFFLEENQKIMLVIEGREEGIAPETKERIEYLLMMGEIEEIDDLKKEGLECFTEIKTLYLKEKLKRLRSEMIEAEKTKDFLRVEEITKEINSSSKLLGVQNSSSKKVAEENKGH